MAYLGAMKPNLKCRWCHGTGKIELLTSIVACDCIFLKKEEKERQQSPTEQQSSEKDLWEEYNNDYENHSQGD
jgi:hypothetical protein